MTANKTWDEATTHLDDGEATTEDPAHNGIYAHLTHQPFSGDGYVFAQAGWLDAHGNTYGLRLPDNMPRPGVELRALYVGLGATTCVKPREGSVDEGEGTR